MDYNDIPLATGDYYRKAAGNPATPARNVYFEQDPTNQETQTSLIRRPGIRKLFEVGSGPIRKIYYRPDTFDNNFFVVSGNSLYRVRRTAEFSFASTNIIANFSSGTDISITASSTLLFITDNTHLYYTDGLSAVNVIATPDDIAISRVAYIAGYIICVKKDSQRFYWIDPGATAINPLNFAEAEGLPDGIVGILILGDQMYLFGKETIEIWYLTGDANSPFQRIQGRLINAGAIDNTACSIFGNDTFAFVAADGTVRLGNGLEKISNPGIEERIRRAVRDKYIADI